MRPLFDDIFRLGCRFSTADTNILSKLIQVVKRHIGHDGRFVVQLGAKGPKVGGVAEDGKKVGLSRHAHFKASHGVPAVAQRHCGTACVALVLVAHEVEPVGLGGGKTFIVFRQLLGRDLTKFGEADAKERAAPSCHAGERIVVPDNALTRVGDDKGLIDAVDDLGHNTAQRRVFRRTAFFLQSVVAVDQKGDRGADDINGKAYDSDDLGGEYIGDANHGESGQEHHAAQNADPGGHRYLTGVTKVLFQFHSFGILS